MRRKQIPQAGRRHLEHIATASGELGRLGEWLGEYRFREDCLDDGYVWLTCVLAAEGVSTGNAGVGCIITDSQGDVVAGGHNQVFAPYFRSDLHAEMVVLNTFETVNRDLDRLHGYTLYTSLEPCPMCTVRIITSGINRVLYAADDVTGGMLRTIERLPDVWTGLAARQTFARADCSPALIRVAAEIFLLNIHELNERIAERGMPGH